MIADFGVSVANDLTRIQLIRRDNNNLKVGAYALFNERLKTYVLMSAWKPMQRLRSAISFAVQTTEQNFHCRHEVTITSTRKGIIEHEC